MTAPVYLSAIAYEVGAPFALEQTTDPVIASELHTLRSEGLRYFRATGGSATTLGIASSRKTLDQLGVNDLDAVVYSTESLDGGSATTSVWELLQGIALPSVPSMTVSGNACGNLAPALRTARNLVHAEGQHRILLVIADALDHDARYQPNGNTVASDSAASCLVSLDPVGSGFRILGVATAVQADLLPETRPIVGARTITRAVQGMLGALRLQIPDSDRGFNWFVTGNYSATTRRFLTRAAGMSDDRTFAPRAAELGHCFAADQLIALATAVERDLLNDGERLLLLTTSSRSWSLIAVEYRTSG